MNFLFHASKFISFLGTYSTVILTYERCKHSIHPNRVKTLKLTGLIRFASVVSSVLTIASGSSKPFSERRSTAAEKN